MKFPTTKETVLTDDPDKMSYHQPGAAHPAYELDARPFEPPAARYARLQRAAQQRTYYDSGRREWSFNATPKQVFKAKLAWELAEIASGLVAWLLRLILIAALAVGLYALWHWKGPQEAPKKPPQQQQQKR